MSKTTPYREQHQDLLGIVDLLSPLLTPAALGKDAGEARRLLTTLAGKLNVHLAMGDKAL